MKNTLKNIFLLLVFISFSTLTLAPDGRVYLSDTTTNAYFWYSNEMHRGIDMVFVSNSRWNIFGNSNLIEEEKLDLLFNPKIHRLNLDSWMRVKN